MPALHVIETGKFPENLKRVDKETAEWESGYWYIAFDTAQRLVGGEIYLHPSQDKSPDFGGTILSVRMVTVGDQQRAVFRFRFMPEVRGMKAENHGWSQEMKIVW